MLLPASAVLFVLLSSESNPAPASVARTEKLDTLQSLAVQAERKLTSAQKKVESCEQELADIESGRMTVVHKTYPARDWTLRQLIHFYKTDADKWERRAEGYREQIRVAEE